MSVNPMSSLPVVPNTALPADVRNGSDKDKQTYQAALGFERQLLTQLTQAMVSTTQDDQDSSSDSGDDSSAGFGSSDAVTQAYNQMLPDQLADGLIAGGGTGLAENLYHALRQEQS